MPVRKILVALVAIVALSACSTITIQPDGNVAVKDVPSYQETRDFFLWGLVGEEHVNVNEVCTENGPAQMQSQQTFVNGFLTAITLGIYAPHSVKVWCDDAILNRQES